MKDLRISHSSVLAKIAAYALLTFSCLPALAFDDLDSLNISEEIMATCLGGHLENMNSAQYAIAERPNGCSIYQLLSDQVNYDARITDENQLASEFLIEVTENTIAEVLTGFFILQKRYVSGPLNPEAGQSLCNYKRRAGVTANACSKQDQEIIRTLSEKIVAELDKLPEEIISQTPTEVAGTINGRLQLLNDQLSSLNKIRVGKREWKPGKGELPRGGQVYLEDYQATCLSHVNSPHGALMTTPYMIEKSGPCRSLIKDKAYGYKFEKRIYNFGKHELVTAKDVEAAVQARITQLGSELRIALEDHNNIIAAGTDLKESEKLDVVQNQVIYGYDSLGIALMNDPYQSALICKAMQRIEDREEFKGKLVVFSDVLMAAGMVTGLGSIAALAGGMVIKALVRQSIKKVGAKALQRNKNQFAAQFSKHKLANRLVNHAGQLGLVASAVSIVEMPVIINVLLKEAEHLNHVQIAAYDQAIRKLSTYGDFSKMSEANQKKSEAEFKAILNGVMIPLDAAVVAYSMFKSFPTMLSQDEALEEFSKLMAETGQLTQAERKTFFAKLKGSSQKRLNNILKAMSNSHPSERSSLLRNLLRSSDESVDAAVAATKAQRSADDLAQSAAEGVKTTKRTAQQQSSLLQAVRNVLSQKQLPQKIKATVVQYLKIHKIENVEFAMDLLKSIPAKRFNQSQHSPMILGFAVRKISDFSNGSAVSLAKAKFIMKDWTDTMISGLSVTLHRANHFLKEGVGRSPREALRKILKSDGLKDADVNKMQKCMAM